MSHRWPDTFFSSLDCKNRIFIPLPSLVENHLPRGRCSLLWGSFQMVGFWLSRINSYLSNLSLSLVAEHKVARGWCAHWRVWMERPAGVGCWGDLSSSNCFAYVPGAPRLGQPASHPNLPQVSFLKYKVVTSTPSSTSFSLCHTLSSFLSFSNLIFALYITNRNRPTVIQLDIKM